MRRTVLISALLLTLPLAAAAQAPDQAAPADAKAQQQALLQRIYEMRMRFQQDRQNAENEARANVRLTSGAAVAGADSPTVTQMRLLTSQQLARFEQRFDCLDVDVDNNGGNTVVICGGNSGDISGSNVTAGRDLISVEGDQP
ncbi:MAG: hypothetical protein R3E86_12370 [Pseudomonadales bacterium]